MLEAIPGIDYNAELISSNQVSVIEYKYNIYYWKRVLVNNEKWEMQLWKYNMREDKEEQVICKNAGEDKKYSVALIENELVHV